MTLLNLVFMLVTFMGCQTNEWNGIIPLKSTRADVEKILGKPMTYSIAQHSASYKTENEEVSVLYSTGDCQIKPSHGWNTPELTVISFSVYPNKKQKFADLNIDESKFEVAFDPEITFYVFYTNKEEGINITVDTTDETIENIHYFPKSKDNVLKCKKDK